MSQVRPASPAAPSSTTLNGRAVTTGHVHIPTGAEHTSSVGLWDNRSPRAKSKDRARPGFKAIDTNPANGVNGVSDMELMKQQRGIS